MLLTALLKPEIRNLYDVQVYSTYRYGFDHVYGPDSLQEEVYQQSAKSAVLNVLDGYNASIVAYGQTGTGNCWIAIKTVNSLAAAGSDRCIVPYMRAVHMFCREDIYHGG